MSALAAKMWKKVALMSLKIPSYAVVCTRRAGACSAASREAAPLPVFHINFEWVDYAALTWPARRYRYFELIGSSDGDHYLKVRRDATLGTHALTSIGSTGMMNRKPDSSGAGDVPLALRPSRLPLSVP